MRSLLIPFLAGAVVVFAVAGIVLLARDGDDKPRHVAGSSTPTPGPYPVLAEGQYIDSLPDDIRTVASGFEAVPLPRSASVAGGIAVVEVTEIIETIVPTPGPGTVTPADRGQPTPWTVYRAQVRQWIKGGKGEQEIRISEIGGEVSEGARLYTGTFLARVGRTYLVSLDPPIPTSPGQPDYIGALTGWANFEIGDGTIRVLNERNSKRLMGAYDLMPLDDFIALVREWIVAPPTPTPSPTTSS